MTRHGLKARELRILECVVEAYVMTAVPVGSRYLVKKYNLGISPATVRNVMNDLEEMGYLTQPHVSAGRIPSDKGYRYYVDSLMPVRALSVNERSLIEEALNSVSDDVDEVLEVSSRVLSEISSQLGVVLEPQFYRGIFNKMELVSLSEQRLLVVLSIRSGLVKTITMEVKSAVSREQLDETSRIINERLHGLSLLEVKCSIDERLSGVEGHNEALVRCIVESSDRLFSFIREKDLHLSGTSNIISEPEFANRSYAERVLELIGSREGIIQYFSSSENEGISVGIGCENATHLLDGCSLISTQYFVGEVSGRLGVLGPTRMPYRRIIPIVSYMGDVLTRTFAARFI
jgi:heat-inducible transcriptional repressor